MTQSKGVGKDRSDRHYVVLEGVTDLKGDSSEELPNCKDSLKKDSRLKQGGTNVRTAGWPERLARTLVREESSI
jgi:hypothetical protein